MSLETHWSRHILRLLLSATSFALVFLVVETGFRVKAYYDDREIDAFGSLGQAPLIRDPNTRVKTANIIRLSRNPDIVYELIPKTHARYKGAIITINNDGFRGPDLPVEHPADTVRIVGIGDSVMFGYGVGDSDYYLFFLQQELARTRGKVSFEIINAGVPGYNTTMQLATLEEKLLRYAPDLVLIEYVSNDLDLPNFIRKPAPYFSFDRPFVWNYIRTVLKGWSHKPDTRLESSGRDTSEIPEEYAHMVGIEGYRRAMSRLAQLRDEHGFEVVVLGSFPLPPEVREIVTGLGFPIVEAHDELEAHLVAQGSTMDDYFRSELVVGDGDPHPSPIGHRIISGVLLQYLEQSGLLERLGEQAQR